MCREIMTTGAEIVLSCKSVLTAGGEGNEWIVESKTVVQ